VFPVGCAVSAMRGNRWNATGNGASVTGLEVGGVRELTGPPSRTGDAEPDPSVLTGKGIAMMPPRFSNYYVSRFWSRVEIDGECWVWRGSRTPDSYGMFWAGRNYRAHRWAYEYMRADIPDGLQLDHLCRNRPCVNPWHVEPVTPGENVRRSMSVAAENARKTHCKRGHPLSGENLKILLHHTGRLYRSCKACQRSWASRAGYVAKPPGTPIPHGTAGGYTNHRCRCEACSRAAADIRRACRLARMERDPDWRKGERQRLATAAAVKIGCRMNSGKA